MDFMISGTNSNFRLIVFCAALVALFELSFFGIADAGDRYRELINCNLHQDACTQILGEVEVTLEVTPKPVKAMRDLSFKVTLTGKLPTVPEAPYIDLGMPGMDMGPNRVQLQSAGNAVYEGRGVIVRCPSGRRIWQATVTIPDLGQTDFIFDVIY